MPSASSVDARLASLESILGLVPTTTTTPGDKDIGSRLDRLLSKHGVKPPTSAPPPTPSKSTATASVNRSTLDEELKVCERLSSELDPGSTLSHQGAVGYTSSATGIPVPAGTGVPLLYRRQEILASKDAMKDGMDQLALVRDSLLISSTSVSTGAEGAVPPVGGKGGKGATTRQEGTGRKIAEEELVNSPILSSERYDLASDPNVIRRLDGLALRVADMNARAVHVAQRVDIMVDRYHAIMAAVSEKMVLADEEIGTMESK